jgi:hypothetical protein
MIDRPPLTRGPKPYAYSGQHAFGFAEVIGRTYSPPRPSPRLLLQ